MADSEKPSPLMVRVTSEEKDAFSRAAESAGLSVSAWVRTRLRASAVEELTKLGQPNPFMKSPARKRA